MTQRNTKIKMIIIFSVSILGIGGMMNHAVKMHELEQQKGTREYYSGEKPATSFPLQNVFANLNPFQKNISKSVYVFEYANDPVMGKYGVVYLEPKCLDQTKSIRKKEFDELLSKGVKITSSIPRKTEVTVGNLYGECVGASYILEGPENLLNKL